MNTLPFRTLAVAVALVVVGTACAGASADEQAMHVTVLADVTGSIADSPDYRGQVEQVLTATLGEVADRRGTVTVLAVKAGRDRPVELLPRSDLSLDGVDGDVAEQARPALATKLVADTMGAYDAAVASAGSGSSALRVMNAVDTTATTHLLVIGDGVEWEGGAKVPLAGEVDGAVDGYVDAGMVPDLSGIRVVHLSAGETSGIDPGQAQTVRRFWVAFYEEAGAGSVHVTGAVDPSALVG